MCSIRISDHSYLRAGVLLFRRCVIKNIIPNIKRICSNQYLYGITWQSSRWTCSKCRSMCSPRTTSNDCLWWPSGESHSPTMPTRAPAMPAALFSFWKRLRAVDLRATPLRQISASCQLLPLHCIWSINDGAVIYSFRFVNMGRANVTYGRIIIDGPPKHLHITDHLKIATKSKRIPNTPQNHAVIGVCASQLWWNHSKCQFILFRKWSFGIKCNWIGWIGAIEIKTTLNRWQRNGHYRSSDLCAECNVIQLAYVHQLCLEQQLADRARHKLSSQECSARVRCYRQVMVFWYFRINVREVGHLARHVRSIKHLTYLWPEHRCSP